MEQFIFKAVDDSILRIEKGAQKQYKKICKNSKFHFIFDYNPDSLYKLINFLNFNFSVINQTNLITNYNLDEIYKYRNPELSKDKIKN